MISVMHHLVGKELTVSVNREKTKEGEPYIVLSFKSNSDYIDLFMTEEQLEQILKTLEENRQHVNVES